MQNSLFEREIDSLDKMRALRPRQEQAIVSVREAIREGHRRIILQAPTGFGKTLVSAHIIGAALQKRSKPLFTCPAISLVDQTYAAFKREGIHDIGVMQAQHVHTNRHASVQIASVQTLVRRECPDVDFALIDEVHEGFDALHAMLDSEEWKSKVVIGLSATPWAKGMGLRWTKLVIAGTINDMIAEGHATPAIIYGPERDVDRDRLKVTRGEFEEASAAAAMSDKAIIGDVLKEWQEKSPHEKTFAFCVNRDHARAQMEAFQDAGIPFGYIDAYTDGPDRRRQFDKMRHGEIAGIASVGCLIRGVDEDVRCVLDLQLNKSEMRHVQKWGRGVRCAEGKSHLLGLDHAGNNHALGLFTDIYHDHLDTRKPGDRGEAYVEDYKPAKPRKCVKCKALIPPGARKCPSCQERYALNPGVTVVDGRLVEIGSGPKINTKERQDWFSGLLWIARKGGLKEGWAAFSYKDRFGEWPKNLRVRGKQPSEEVKQFVKQRRQEYLARKKANDSSGVGVNAQGQAGQQGPMDSEMPSPPG